MDNTAPTYIEILNEESGFVEFVITGPVRATWDGTTIPSKEVGHLLLPGPYRFTKDQFGKLQVCLP